MNDGMISQSAPPRQLCLPHAPADPQAQSHPAHLCHPAPEKRTLCQAKLARAFPGKAKHLHKKKQLHCFGTNGGVRPLSLSLQLVPTIMERFGGDRVAVNLDWTPLRAREQALFASLPLEGRGLPLLFWATSFGKLRSGTSQNDLEEALVRRLVLTLPEGVWPVLVADRGFGRVSFLLFLQGLKRALSPPEELPDPAGRQGDSRA